MNIYLWGNWRLKLSTTGPVPYLYYQSLANILYDLEFYGFKMVSDPQAIIDNWFPIAYNVKVQSQHFFVITVDHCWYRQRANQQKMQQKQFVVAMQQSL